MTNHLDQLLAPEDPARLAALQDALAARANADGLLDLGYRTVDSPLGPLLVVATDQGLVRLAFETEGVDQVLATLAHTVSPRILRAPARTEQVARELDEFFTGRRRTFDVPLDLRLSEHFGLTVRRHLLTIPYGRTESYAEVAREVGNPKAVRAVGTACARNPIPVVVPCHRVLRSDGSLGGYRGGPDAKRLLLDLEAAA